MFQRYKTVVCVGILVCVCTWGCLCVVVWVGVDGVGGGVVTRLVGRVGARLRDE